MIFCNDSAIRVSTAFHKRRTRNAVLFGLDLQNISLGVTPWHQKLPHQTVPGGNGRAWAPIEKETYRCRYRKLGLGDRECHLKHAVSLARDSLHANLDQCTEDRTLLIFISNIFVLKRRALKGTNCVGTLTAARSTG